MNHHCQHTKCGVFDNGILPTLALLALIMIAQRTMHKFTADEFWQMEELGFFNRERVELLNGEILEMSPQTDWHWFAVSELEDRLKLIYDRNNFTVRNQATLDLRPFGVVDPDLAVVRGPRSSFRGNRHVPRTAVLVVEVAESTLHDDRVRKGSLYAASGIPEYWIVNLVNHVLEVHRDPQADTTAEFGSSYTDVHSFTADQSIAPLGLTASVPIADLFPIVQPDESERG